jgi:hypothetical protein
VSVLFTVRDRVPAQEAGLADAGFDAANALAAPLHGVAPVLQGFAPGIVKYTMVRRSGQRESDA